MEICFWKALIADPRRAGVLLDPLGDVRVIPMSKSQVDELMSLYRALLKDIAYSRPALEASLGLDLARLESFAQSGGYPTFVVALPAIGKHFDRCLDNGQYTSPGLPLTKRRPGRGEVPLFLGQLHLLVFSEDGCLREDCDTEAVLFLRQIYYCAKKADSGIETADSRRETEEFVTVDLELPSPEYFWEEEAPDLDRLQATYRGFGNVAREWFKPVAPTQNPEWLGVFLGNLDAISMLLCTSWEHYIPKDWKHKHGPGAVARPIGPTNKYLWDNWSPSLENVFPIADHGFHDYLAWVDRVQDWRAPLSSDYTPSRLVAVPKTYRKPRLIAAEPCENMWCQQNIKHYMTTMTERSWLNRFVRFDDQTLNQTLCQRGSISGDLCTADLKAASDRMTCRVVGEMFRYRPELLLALQSTRTRSVDLMGLRRDDGVPDVHKLKKFSTMGSACTFPVQSVVFLAITLAAVITHREMAPTLGSIASLEGSVAVFGDDIIVPSDCRETLFAGLESLWFKVNVGKTFGAGRFRESCGVDAFQGVNVTPVYWHAPANEQPESIASAVQVRNNFYSKFYLNAAECVATALPRHTLPLVHMGSGVCGLKSFSSIDNSHLKWRWNRGLQRIELLAGGLTTNQRTVRFPKERRLRVLRMECPSRSLDSWQGGQSGCPSLLEIPPLEMAHYLRRYTDNSALHQWFTENPPPHSKWVSGYRLEPVQRWKNRWVSLQEVENPLS